MNKSALVLTFLGLVLVTMLAAVPALAQQTTGVPGSPGATTTISGKQLPPPPPKFGGKIERTLTGRSPGGRPGWCRPRARPTCC